MALSMVFGGGKFLKASNFGRSQYQSISDVEVLVASDSEFELDVAVGCAVVVPQSSCHCEF
jgi:hypothetical protein